MGKSIVSPALAEKVKELNSKTTTQEMLSGDLNNVGEGQVYASGSTTNRPDSAPFIIKTYDYGTSKAQLAFKRDFADVMYFRVCNSGTWYGWQQLALNSNVTPQDITSSFISDANGHSLVDSRVTKIGKLIVANIIVKKTDSSEFPANDSSFTISSSYRPSATINEYCVFTTSQYGAGMSLGYIFVAGNGGVIINPNVTGKKFAKIMLTYDMA